MTEIRKNQKVLHAKVNGEWRYVFCNNIPNGLITMEATPEKRKKAIHGDNALEYFQKRYADVEFCYSVELPDLTVRCKLCGFHYSLKGVPSKGGHFSVLHTLHGTSDTVCPAEYPKDWEEEKPTSI